VPGGTEGRLVVVRVVTEQRGGGTGRGVVRVVGHREERPGQGRGTEQVHSEQAGVAQIADLGRFLVETATPPRCGSAAVTWRVELDWASSANASMRAAARTCAGAAAADASHGA
jgi:hypothetical protein